MYVIQEVRPLVGRPKRKDITVRTTYKLNTGIRKLIQNESTLNQRSESAQVERLALEAETIKRIMKKNPDLAALFYPKFNEEYPTVSLEITEVENND